MFLIIQRQKAKFFIYHRTLKFNCIYKMFIHQNFIPLVTFSIPLKALENFWFVTSTEAVAWKCSVKNIFLKIAQNLQENTCARDSFLIMLQAKSFQNTFFLVQVLPCEFCESFKKPFFIEHLWWLLLNKMSRQQCFHQGGSVSWKQGGSVSWTIFLLLILVYFN